MSDLLLSGVENAARSPNVAGARATASLKATMLFIWAKHAAHRIASCAACSMSATFSAGPKREVGFCADSEIGVSSKSMSPSSPHSNASLFSAAHGISPTTGPLSPLLGICGAEPSRSSRDSK
eukprot:scaffold240857_cov30-Tisochrysis_lutea.AAC.5